MTHPVGTTRCGWATRSGTGTRAPGIWWREHRGATAAWRTDTIARPNGGGSSPWSSDRRPTCGKGSGCLALMRHLTNWGGKSPHSPTRRDCRVSTPSAWPSCTSRSWRTCWSKTNQNSPIWTLFRWVEEIESHWWTNALKWLTNANYTRLYPNFDVVHFSEI